MSKAIEAAARGDKMSDIAKIEIENFTSPNWRGKVDRAKYEAMRDALLAALPGKSPGLTAADAKAKLLPHLPEEQFPRGDKAGWWLKAVQLDLEAEGVITREPTKPLRFHHT